MSGLESSSGKFSGEIEGMLFDSRVGLYVPSLLDYF